MNFVRSIISFVSAIFSFYKNQLLQPHLKFFRILCLGLFLLPTTSKGQKVIYMHDFKPAILEAEIKKGIDSVRIAHKLSPLVNDSICRWELTDFMLIVC